MKFEIKHRFSGSVLFSFETSSLKLAVEAAVGQGAYLKGAYLKGAYLKGADLKGADLEGADLEGANLEGAGLGGADLKGAYLKGADLKGAYLKGADLEGADLKGADLKGADLYGSKLENLPQDYINQCSRDILFILGCLKAEVPALRKALVEGRVNGRVYEGECACLVGTLANADGGLTKVCNAIPFYERGTHNFGESFFLNIREGDTPEKNSFAAHAVKLCDMVVPPTKEPKAKKRR